ncbi:MAG: hypothetical protein K2Z25_11580, partial [Beijerinckiaceae bacterium]|nr:hypothetical protein [Beijerinckiaceae bacterium]
MSVIATTQPVQSGTVLRSDETSRHLQRSVIANGDDTAGQGLLGSDVAFGRAPDRIDALLDLGKASLVGCDLVIAIGIGLDALGQGVVALAKGCKLGLLGFGVIATLRMDAPISGMMDAVGLDANFRPVPPLQPDRISHRLQPLGRQPHSQGSVGQERRLVLEKQVTQDCATGGLIGVYSDEAHKPIGAAQILVRQCRAQVARAAAPAIAAEPCRLLRAMVVTDRQRASLLDRDLVGAHRLQNLRRQSRQLQALTHRDDGLAEPACDRVSRKPVRDKALIGQHLVHDMHGLALGVFSKRDFGIALGRQ